MTATLSLDAPMPKDDRAALFTWCRTNGIDPLECRAIRVDGDGASFLMVDHAGVPDAWLRLPHTTAMPELKGAEG